MASSLTSPGLVTAGDKAIIAARPALERLSLFATDFSDDAIDPGTTLKIPVFAGTAVSFDAANSHGYNDAEGTIKYAAVGFDTHVKLTFGLSGRDRLAVDTDPYWAKCGIAAGQAVSKALLTAATAPLSYSSATQVTSWSVTLANLAALRGQCAANGFDPANSVVLLEPASYATLLTLLPANVIGDGSVAVNGIINGLYGFKAVIEANTISKYSAADTQKGVGFVVPSDALAIAGRVIRPQEGVCEEFGTTTDEITGLTLGHRVTVDQNSGTRYYTVEAVLGAAASKQSSNGAPGFLQLVTA